MCNEILGMKAVRYWRVEPRSIYTPVYIYINLYIHKHAYAYIYVYRRVHVCVCEWASISEAVSSVNAPRDLQGNGLRMSVANDLWDEEEEEGGGGKGEMAMESEEGL